jgi:aldehyde dehydrogenase (NAD+)
MVESTSRSFVDTGSAVQGKMVNEFHLKRVMKLIETAGGKIMLGGKANLSTKHIEPTIIFNPNRDSQILDEEIFGPVLPILTYSNFDEVLDFINDKPKPLAVYFYGKPSHKEAHRLQNETSSGAVGVNDCFMQVISHY